MKSVSELRSEVNHTYRIWETSGYCAAIALKRHQMFVNSMENLEFYMRSGLVKRDLINREFLKLPRLIKVGR